MHKYTLLFLLLAGLSQGYSQTTFNAVYGSSSSDWGYAVMEDSDSNVVVAGYGEVHHFFICKLTPYGDTLWTKTIGSGSNSEVRDIMQTDDGHYLIVGYEVSGGHEFFVVKTDMNGNKIWSNTYGDTGAELAQSCTMTQDGKYAVFGYTNSVGVGSSDYYFLKLDTDGTVLEKQNIGGTDIDHGYKIIATADGGFIMAGSTISYGQGSDETMVIKTNSTGVPQWQKVYGSVQSDACYDAAHMSNGDVVLLSDTWGWGPTKGACLQRINSAGDTVWTRFYSHATENVHSYAIDTTLDGGLVVTGYMASGPFGGDDGFIFRTDGSGNLLWSKVYGGSVRDRGHDISSTLDGGFLMTGPNQSVQSTYGLWVVKTDANGNSGCQEADANLVMGYSAPVVATVTPTNGSGNLPATAQTWSMVSRYPAIDTLCTSSWPQDGTIGLGESDMELSIYPNPSSGLVYIAAPSLSGNVMVYDLLGAEVGTFQFVGETELDLSHLPNGLYTVVLTSNAEVATHRLVIRR